MAAQPKDPRERLAKAADPAVRKGIETLQNAMDMEKWQACPKCGERVFFKDVRAITQALQFFMDYGFGKPATQAPKKAEEAVKAKKIEDLTDEELEALLSDLEGGSGKAHGSAAQEAAR